MEKTKKKIFGLLGLLLVAAITVFAAFLPGPEAAATSEVVDTVQIRVIGGQPNVEIVGDLKKEKVVTSPEQGVTVDYDNLNHITVTLKYTDKDGAEHTFTLVDQDLDYGASSMPINLDLSQGSFGYGDYVLTVEGRGDGGASDVAGITFSYIPVKAEVVEDEKSGDVTVELDYDPDTGSPEDEGKVKEIGINIYDEDGNLMEPSPIIVEAPADSVDLPFGDYNYPSGKYTIEVIARDRDGNVLYEIMRFDYDYKAIPVPHSGGDDGGKSAGSPDTGGLFKGLNISRSDYLITGLTIFLIVGIGSTIYIVKRDQKTKK
ncbi:hypothetical protein IKF92_00865 [Candidatus Saccharibacteria bacterium]|nr:hypothetical protein [Candidatus Saccharibacteria bacterium]